MHYESNGLIFTMSESNFTPTVAFTGCVVLIQI